jgi:hypothetical protein
MRTTPAATAVCRGGRARRPPPSPPTACPAYVATADDFSLVKPFNGPVVADDAPFRVYRGHLSHVKCMWFSHGDRRLFSVGVLDRCGFQRRTVGINQEDQAVDAYVLRAVEGAACRKYQVRAQARGGLYRTSTSTASS